VGKTTTAVNLAVALAEAGNEVLLIDMDPQGNASTGLGIAPDQREVNAFDLLMGESTVAQTRVATQVPGLSVIPASQDLASLDHQLAGRTDRLMLLRRALEVEPQRGFVLIDCPPTLGVLTLNALIAADGLLAPLQSEFYALEGLSHLLQTLKDVRKLNPKLRLEGIVLTMHDARNNLARQVEADAREHLGEVVFPTVIPRNVRVSEAPSHGQSVLTYEPQSRGSVAYRSLAAEYLARIDARMIT